MADDPPPADFKVSRASLNGGMADIYACRVHLAHTKQVLMDNNQLAGPVLVGPANPEVHGCKGHLDNWPVS